MCQRTTTTPAEPSRNCVSCNGSTDDVGPLCPIEGPYYDLCGDCYADIRADEDYNGDEGEVPYTGYYEEYTHPDFSE